MHFYYHQNAIYWFGEEESSDVIPLKMLQCANIQIIIFFGMKVMSLTL